MRILFIIPLVLLSLVSFPVWGLTLDDLVTRDGLYYKKFTDNPFSGNIDGKHIGSFKNGLRDGAWVTYYENGQLRDKGNYQNGVQQGLWTAYTDYGKLESTGNFVAGKREGFWLVDELWHGRGEGHYINGKKEGLWINYGERTKAAGGGYEVKSIQNYQNDVREGPFENFWEGGKPKAKGKFKNGKRNGYWVFYDSDGSVYQAETGMFQNGVKVRD